MARPLRIEFPGAVYHIASRGDKREKIERIWRYYAVTAGRAKRLKFFTTDWILSQFNRLLKKADAHYLYPTCSLV